MPATISSLGRGTTFWVQNPVGGAYVQLLQVEEFDPPRAVADEIEVTNLSSDAKEFQVDLDDWGESRFTEIVDFDKPQFDVLEALRASKDVTGWRIIFVSGKQLDWSGRIKERGPTTIAQQNVNKYETVIRNTGIVTVSG